MKKGMKVTAGAAVAALAAFSIGHSATASELTIMPIGDSFTWGFTYDNPDGTPSGSSFQSNGGWRVLLDQKLAANTDFDETFSFIGQKGDGVVTGTERAGDDGVPGNPSDSLDGPNSTVALHEGYGGWVIDGARIGSSPSDDRQGILENIFSPTNSNEFATVNASIDPASADIVMLQIGVNNVLGASIFSGAPDRPTIDDLRTSGILSDIVDDLGVLIREIVEAAPDTIVLVSNLYPVVENRDPFLGSNTDDLNNAAIDEFNSLVHDRFFGDDDGVFDEVFMDDLLDSEVFALHNEFDNVALIDAHSAIDNTVGAGDLFEINNDFLHPTQQGYHNLAQFYADRFAGLGLGRDGVLIPEPATAALLLAGASLVAGRGRRRAAWRRRRGSTEDPVAPMPISVKR